MKLSNQAYDVRNNSNNDSRSEQRNEGMNEDDLSQIDTVWRVSNDKVRTLVNDKQFTKVMFTCDMRYQHLFDGADWMIAPKHAEWFEGETAGCYEVDFINIRGHKCSEGHEEHEENGGQRGTGGTVRFKQTSEQHLHVVSGGHTPRCQCHPWFNSSLSKGIDTIQSCMTCCVAYVYNMEGKRRSEE